MLVGLPSGNPSKIGTLTTWNRTRTPPDRQRVFAPGQMLQGRALYGPIPVKTETFREL